MVLVEKCIFGVIHVCFPVSHPFSTGISQAASLVIIEGGLEICLKVLAKSVNALQTGRNFL